MKKIILLLLLHVAFANVFGQTIIFQEPFDNPNFPPAWHINDGNWQIVNLTQKGIKPPGGNNYFALESTGSSEIQIDIPVTIKESVTQIQISFNYWVYSNPAGGIVAVDLLNDKGVVLSHAFGQELTQKGKWELLDRKFKVTNNVFFIRLKLNGLLSPLTTSNVYFKNIVISKR